MNRFRDLWMNSMAVAALFVASACAENSAPELNSSVPSEEPELSPAAALLKERALPLNDAADLTPLLERVGDARLVLLGEASHGTSEFYTWRATISQRLIEEKGFNFIAVEGDWQTLWLLNQYVKHREQPFANATEIMQTFDRWPPWMWANEETRDLIEWLRAYNADRPMGQRVGFYGMDVYGEDQSKAVLRRSLDDLDEETAALLTAALDCLAPFHGNMHDYARAVAHGRQSPCQPALEAAFTAMQEWVDRAESDADERFALKMSTKVLKNAEQHFRLMAQQGPQSWNARADHFYAAVAQLLEWYGDDSRGIAWAHNTHIGDARATAMAGGGQRNIGQIARQRHPADDVVAVGFGTHRGTVQAGRQWGQAMETMQVPPGIAGSVEDFMHQTGKSTALFIFDPAQNWSPLETVLGHRAMGVVYNPEVEHRGNYVPTLLTRRYDAFIFIDETKALRPIR